MKSRIALIVIIAGLVLACVSCKRKENNNEIKTALDEKMINNLPKEIVHLETIDRELKFNGRIVPDEARQASVYALVSGRISQVNVELGDYVRKGQTLAMLKSAEVAGVNNELALAKSNLEIARKNRDTYKELYESNLLSEREFITVSAEYEKALSELQKAENVSAITGGENSMYRLISPLNGYIIAKNITNNSEVRSDMAEPLFSIADISVVWILVNVFEIDINQIQLGQAVEVHTLFNHEKTYEGKIDKIYNVLDPETRSMKARVSLANVNNNLMPGMFVSVKVKAKNRQTAVAIPSNAIIFDNNEKYVIVLKENKPQIRSVKEIFRNGNKCYVEGIDDGETLITDSQVFLFEALNSK